MRSLAYGVMVFVWLVTVSAPTSAWCCPEFMQPVADEQRSSFIQMLGSFQIYESFLAEAEEAPEGLLLPLHGLTREQAHQTLSRGFSSQLANDILLTYTSWNTDHQRLQIIATDGIPILKLEDFADLSYRRFPSGHILFHKTYRNCFHEGDAYHFWVLFNEDTSLIEALRLTECPHTLTNPCELP